MKTVMRMAARLYPATWRRRYSAEFDALLEQIDPGGRELLDVLRGAMQMQWRTWNIGTAAIVFGVLGVIVAGVFALTRVNVYQSTAVLKLNGNLDQWARNMNAAEQEVLSRSSLSQLVATGDLYPKERRSEPLEDIVQDMRNRSIQIRVIPNGHTADAKAFTVAFQYPEAAKAQFVTKQVVSKLMDAIAKKGGAPIEVLDPASLPSDPVSPRRSRILIMGLIGGLLAGSLIFGIGRWPTVAIVAVATGAVALAISFAIPDKYISNSVVWLPNASMARSLTERTRNDVAFLQQIARERHLYDGDPASAVAQMKKDIQIRPVTPPGASDPSRIAVLISFTYAGPRSNHDLARTNTQGVVRDIVARWVQLARVGTPNTEVEILDPASYPERAVWPNRAVLGGFGLLAGVLLAIAWKFARRAPVLGHA